MFVVWTCGYPKHNYEFEVLSLHRSNNLLRGAICYSSYVKIIFTLGYDDGIWEILIKNISCLLYKKWLFYSTVKKS